MEMTLGEYIARLQSFLQENPAAGNLPMKADLNGEYCGYYSPMLPEVCKGRFKADDTQDTEYVKM